MTTQDRAAPMAARRTTRTEPRLLMCPPEFYGVEYVINPWMETGMTRAAFEAAAGQWSALKAALSGAMGIVVETLPGRPGLPDLVFTANAGLVAGDVFVPSRFRYAERAGEEPFFTEWAREAGFRVVELPHGIAFEGAGDALFDRALPVLWMGHGFRTDLQAAKALDAVIAPTGFQVVPLGLVDPRFYHVDTCLCPLKDGSLLYYPPAFDAASQARIASLVPSHSRIAVGEEDALHFACNAVNVGREIALNNATDALRTELQGRGYHVHKITLTEFLCAGGGAKCLTLRLDEPVGVHAYPSG